MRLHACLAPFSTTPESSKNVSSDRELGKRCIETWEHCNCQSREVGLIVYIMLTLTPFVASAGIGNPGLWHKCTVEPFSPAPRCFIESKGPLCRLGSFLSKTTACIRNAILLMSGYLSATVGAAGQSPNRHLRPQLLNITCVFSVEIHFGILQVGWASQYDAGFHRVSHTK